MFILLIIGLFLLISILGIVDACKNNKDVMYDLNDFNL